MVLASSSRRFGDASIMGVNVKSVQLSASQTGVNVDYESDEKVSW